MPLVGLKFIVSSMGEPNNYLFRGIYSIKHILEQCNLLTTVDIMYHKYTSPTIYIPIQLVEFLHEIG